MAATENAIFPHWLSCLLEQRAARQAFNNDIDLSRNDK